MLFYRYKCFSIDINVLGEEMDGFIVAALTFILSFVLFIDGSRGINLPGGA